MSASLALAQAGDTVPDFDQHFQQRAGVRSVVDRQGQRSAIAMLSGGPERHRRPWRRHSIEFEFYSPNYFIDANQGHFAIGVRGSAVLDGNGDGRPDVQGHGVILGNVSAYPPQPGHPACGPTRWPNTVAIESFWAGGNCVWGPDDARQGSPSQPVVNHRWYRLRVVSTRDTTTRPARRSIQYQLWQQTPAGRWQRIAHRRVPDDARNRSDPRLGGWFVGEVFSTHDWDLFVRRLRVHRQ